MLEKYSFFGEYHCLNNKLAKFTYTALSETSDVHMNDLKLDRIKSNTTSKIKNERLATHVKFMCIHRSDFMTCCDLWENSSSTLRSRAIKRNKTFLQMSLKDI